MTKPLALVFYERLMPGSQLVNRLADLGYRVTTATDLAQVSLNAEKETPMVIILDLTANTGPVIQELRAAPKTGHIPIIGFAAKANKAAQNAAVEAGAKLVAIDDAILPQLPHLLEQALEVE